MSSLIQWEVLLEGYTSVCWFENLLNLLLKPKNLFRLKDFSRDLFTWPLDIICNQP